MPKAGKRPSATHILDSMGTFRALISGSWTPCVDMAERDNHLLIKVELPGVAPEDVSINVQSNLLTLKGVKREAELRLTRTCYYCVERTHGRFYREITLPFLVDAQHAKASLQDGILQITLKRMQDRRGQIYEIPVRKGDATTKP